LGVFHDGEVAVIAEAHSAHGMAATVGLKSLMGSSSGSYGGRDFLAGYIIPCTQLSCESIHALAKGHVVRQRPEPPRALASCKTIDQVHGDRQLLPIEFVEVLKGLGAGRPVVSEGVLFIGAGGRGLMAQATRSGLGLVEELEAPRLVGELTFWRTLGAEHRDPKGDLVVCARVSLELAARTSQRAADEDGEGAGQQGAAVHGAQWLSDDGLALRVHASRASEALSLQIVDRESGHHAPLAIMRCWPTTAAGPQPRVEWIWDKLAQWTH
jgi:hypothetical protein